MISRAVRYGKPASETSSRVTSERMSRARGPPQAETDPAGRHVTQPHGPVVGQVLAQPRGVVVADGRPGNQQVRVGRQAGHGQVGLDPAAPVEQLGVDDRADRAIDVVGAHPARGTRWRRDPRSRAWRTTSRRRARPPGGWRGLGTDRRRPMDAGPAARPERLVAGGRVGLEPVRALPAGLLAERRAQAVQDLVGRRGPQRAAGEALLVRVVDVVVRGVDLGRARQRVRLRSIRGAEAADVHLPQVELGLAVDDPGRHLAPDPPGAGDPVGAEAGGHEEAANLALTEDELVVRGEPLRAVDHPVDARVADRRDAPDGAVHDLGEARPVGRQQLAVEVGRHAVERPRRRMALVAAHAQPADLLAEVDQVVGVAELRAVRGGRPRSAR